MKTDARARYTRHVIEESFIALLRQKPAARITVRELCDACEINRATFYHHYKDVFDLLAQMEQALIDRFCALMGEQDYHDMTALHTRALLLLQQDRELYSVLCSANGSPDFSARLFNAVYRQAFPYLQSKVTHLDPATQNRLYQYLAHGGGYVMHAWAKEGMREPPEQVAAFLDKAARGVTAAFMP